MEAWTKDKTSWVLPICLILIAAQPASSNIYEDFQCPDTHNCSCYAEAVTYKIVCHDAGVQQSEIEIGPGNNVKLRCLGEENSNYANISLPIIRPNMSCESFTFYNCPLPDGSLVDVLYQLGLKKVQKIIFVTDRRKELVHFKRHHFKGLNEVTGLDLSNNGIEKIAEDIFDDIKTLKTLNLENNRIHLSLGHFKALPDLESLNLSQNRLHYIPSGIFKYSKSLKVLNLGQNYIGNLTDSTFEGLVHLNNLDMSSNKINTLPTEVFYSLARLNNLNLSGNHINTFPDELFMNNDKLEILDLSYNEQALMKIPSKLIHSLEKLAVINLKKCMISLLPESFFWNLTEIRNISLSGNMLNKIEENLLRDQKSLVFLDLNDNEIKKVANLAFRTLTELEVLKMDNNKMSHISEKIFEHLISLKDLSMKNNNMREIDTSAFIATRNIENIDLSHNMLTMAEGNELLEFAHLREIIEPRSPFHCLGKLKHLNLSHNWISEIYSDWKYELLELKSLDLTYNNISCIMFGNLNFLSNGIIVDLRYNNISTIDFKLADHFYQTDTTDDVASSTTSPKVLIDNNPLHCDCLLYGFVRYLEGKLSPKVKNIVRVEAGSAQCSTPSELSGRFLKDLKEEDMLCPLDEPRSSYTKMCPANCTCFVRVSDKSIIVNCSNSQARLLTVTLPNVESNNLNCTEVHFERNHLKDLSLFSSKRSTFDQITKLFVAGNNISYLNIEDIPTRIEHLDLSNNLLTYISRAVVDTLNNSSSLKYFWISGNPLQCAPENLPLFSFLEKNYLKVKDYNNITCADGKSMSNYMKEQSPSIIIT